MTEPRPVCVHQPHLAPAEHRVDMDEVIDWASCAFTDHRMPEKFQAVMRNTTVRTRYYIRTAKEIFTQGTGPDQWPTTLSLLAGLAVRAAAAALEASNLAPAQIDALIVTSVTGYAMPGIDVALIRELGLRPTVRRIPVAQIGCVGGLYGLMRAREQIKAYPGSKVLVVASEAFSSTTSPHARRLDAMIYKALGGDGAASAVVTEPDQLPAGQPHVLMDQDDPLEYLIPGTSTHYQLTSDANGQLGFGSTPAAPGAILAARPALDEWLGQRELGFLVAHHGGPVVLDNTAKVLAADRWQLRHSWTSLEQLGNVGSVSFLDVLRRTLDEIGPDAARGEGTALAIGPGVTLCAARLTRPA